jgi:hypothetical protein
MDYISDQDFRRRFVRIPLIFQPQERLGPQEMDRAGMIALDTRRAIVELNVNFVHLQRLERTNNANFWNCWDSSSFSSPSGPSSHPKSSSVSCSDLNSPRLSNVANNGLSSVSAIVIMKIQMQDVHPRETLIMVSIML